jgi:hypothetical protein
VQLVRDVLWTSSIPRVPLSDCDCVLIDAKAAYPYLGANYLCTGENLVDSNKRESELPVH